MMKRNLFVVLFGALALTAAPMIGCGGTDDPSENNQENNMDPNNGESNNGESNNGESNNGESNNGESNNGESNNGEQNNSTPGVECELNTPFFGQIGQEDFHEGGEPIDEPLDVSAGLQDVMDALEGEVADEDDDVTIDLSDDPISVSGAVVTATNNEFQPGEISGFYLEDADAAIYVYNDFAGLDADQFRVGDEVSFEVTEIGTFRMNPQITGIDNWNVEYEDVGVPVHTVTDEPLEVQEDLYRIVKMAFEIPDAGEGEECGPATCYDVTYGDNHEFSIEIRLSNNLNYEAGECRTFVGPLTTTLEGGLFGDDPLPQLEPGNFDWLSSPAF